MERGKKKVEVMVGRRVGWRGGGEISNYDVTEKKNWPDRTLRGGFNINSPVGGGGL